MYTLISLQEYLNDVDDMKSMKVHISKGENKDVAHGIVINQCNIPAKIDIAFS